MKRFSRTLSLMASAAMAPALGSGGAAAQQGAEAAGAPAGGLMEELVVTGTQTARTGFDTPQSVSLFSEEQIERFTASSQADILTQLPGVSAEGGGGEVATNFFVRGLPSGGQFQFTPLQYDGIPAFTTFGLNSSAFDVYVRNDLSIQRLEYVTGGVSNLFGPGSVAGIINYITKKGQPETRGTLQVEGANRGGRFRGDAFVSGPIGGADSNTFYALSGYYRYDEGPLVSGLETEGFQLRGNVSHDFDDGSGSITFYGQLIDDRVQFFLPLPLDGDSRERVRGNDGNTVFTVNTAEAANLSFMTPDGLFESPIEDGVETRGGAFAFVFDKAFDDGWALNVKAKYARYDHEFNLFLDGDGVVNLPETLGDFLDNRGLGDLADASFTFTNSGTAVPGDFLLFANRTLDRDRDATDFSGEVNLSKALTAWGMDHTVTVGGYIARGDAEDFNVITTYLADFSNQPSLVDVVIADVVEDGDGNLIAAPGQEFRVTRNGVLNANGITGDRDRQALRYAVYVADQIETERWAFDVGFRVERFEGDIVQRNLAQIRVGDDPTLNDAIEVVGFNTGQAFEDSVSETEWAAAVSGLYRINTALNVFANFSRGFFFPQLNGQSFDDFGQLGPYNSEIILTAEVGVKYETDRFQGAITGFYTNLDDRQAVEFVNDPDNPGQTIDIVETTSTRAFGIEAGGVFYITDTLSVNGNVTWRDHQFTEIDGVSVDTELTRQPDLIFNTGLTYDDGRFDFSLFHNFHGANFANSANTVRLDSYNLVRLEAGYRIALGDESAARLSVSVFNLFDSEGLAEGSPRLGNFQSGDTAFFVGRPILPRRVQVRATYSF